MKIKIEYKSIYESINILADTELNIIICNGEKASISAAMFKEALLDIIFKWENELINPDIKDAESYKISIIEEDDVFNFVGQGLYPENFIEFKNLLLEVAHE